MARSKKPKTRKLTDADWLKIRELYQTEQMSNYRIADEFGITEGAVRGRAKRENWQRSSAVRQILTQAVIEGHRSPNSDFPQIASDPAIANGANQPTSSSSERPSGVGMNERSPQVGKVHINCLDRSSYENLRHEAASDADDMLMGLQNARDMMALIGTEISHYQERSDEFGTNDYLPIDSKRVNDLATANGKAIEQIRRIRGMDKELPDELEALQVLVDAKWLPMELLVEAMKRFQSLKPALRRDFREHYALTDLDAEALQPTTEGEVPIA